MSTKELWEAYTIPELVEALLTINYSDGEALAQWLRENGPPADVDRWVNQVVFRLQYALKNSKDREKNGEGDPTTNRD